jgi:hypothetical protein
MGLLSRVGAGRRRKLEEFLRERLEEGESLQAMLPMTQTGNPAVLGELIAEFGMVASPPSYYGIGVTDRSLYLVSWRSSVPERPEEVMATVPRSDVAVKKWSPSRLLSGTLVLALRGEELDVEVPSMHRDDADELVAALGGADGQ